MTSFTKDGLVSNAGSLLLQAPPKDQGGPPVSGLDSWTMAADGGIDMTFVTLRS
jgi:hypothetical protein